MIITKLKKNLAKGLISYMNAYAYFHSVQLDLQSFQHNQLYTIAIKKDIIDVIRGLPT